MKNKGQLSCSKGPATAAYPESGYSPYLLHPIFARSIQIFFPSTPRISKCSLPSGFATKILYVLLISKLLKFFAAFPIIIP
jgi:hypothetical protein